MRRTVLNGVLHRSLCLFVFMADLGSAALTTKTRPELPSALEGSSDSLVFAHVVAGGGFSTTFMLVNTGSTASASSLTLTDQSGNPFTVTVTGISNPAVMEGATEGQTGSCFPITIPPGGTLVMTAGRPGEPDIESGWARVEGSGGSLGGVAEFQRVEGEILKSFAGVLASKPLEMAALPVDNDDSTGRFAGFAVANPGVSDIRLNLLTLDKDGALLDSVHPGELNPLRPHNQIARFLHEYLPARLRFRGSMVLSAGPERNSRSWRFSRTAGFLRRLRFWRRSPLIPQAVTGETPVPRVMAVPAMTAKI